MSAELRAEVEAEIGIKPAKVARVGNTRRRVPPPAIGAPSHWPKTIMANLLPPAAALAAGLVAGFIAGRLS